MVGEDCEVFERQEGEEYLQGLDDFEAFILRCGVIALGIDECTAPETERSTFSIRMGLEQRAAKLVLAGVAFDGVGESWCGELQDGWRRDCVT